MSSAFSITVDSSAWDRQLDAIGQGVVEAARPAAQAGAQVLYDAYVSNLARIRRVTGNLRRAAYQAYMDGDTAGGRASYRVSWNTTKAPHGHLIEYGFLQRYEMARDSRGRIFPMVRPEMRGKPKPKRRASQAVKDAYYVPRKGGPLQIAAKAPLRSAASQVPRARQAMLDRFYATLRAKGHIR